MREEESQRQISEQAPDASRLGSCRQTQFDKLGSTEKEGKTHQDDTGWAPAARGC